MYMPVIRIKEGERRALANLEAQTSDGLLPLFDVQRNDAKTALHVHVRDSIDMIRQVWPVDSEFLVDLSQVPSEARCHDGTHPITAIEVACREARLSPTFVYAFDRNDAPYDEAVIAAASSGQVPPRIAFRLQEHDLLFWQETMDRITGILTRGKLTASQSTIIVDLQALTPSTVDEDTLKERLLALERQGYARLVLLASSMPRSEDIGADSEITVRRLEVVIWESLRRSIPTLLFGDYGIVHPHFVHLKGSQAPIPAPKAKYATPTSWHIIKGHKPIKGHANQYPGIARRIVRSSWFRSNDLGWGSDRIREVSNRGSGKTGAPTDWTAFCTEIHLAITVKQVSVAVRTPFARVSDSTSRGTGDLPDLGG